MGIKKIDRWIKLNDLPKKEGTTRISWENSIGYLIKFKYKDLIGEIKILNFLKGILVIEYDNKIYRTTISVLSSCRMDQIFGFKEPEFKKNIGDIIVTDKKDFIILEQLYIPNKSSKKRGYKYKCNKCGYEGIYDESTLLSDIGCPACTVPPRIIVPEINSIIAHEETHWMIPYFQGGYEEAKLYTPQSTARIEFKCPNCGMIKSRTVGSLYNFGFGCICGDGVSYPNKFMCCLLNQLNILYNTEKKFNWSNNKRYDIYIPDIFIIIENHGGYHYINTTFTKLKDIQLNDQYKKKLALSNNVIHYIELDCQKSELEWIKNSVMKSDLPNLLEFKEEDIDWIECDKYATKNIVKEVCILKNINQKYSIKQISNIFHLHEGTIKRYLRNGNKLGWC